MLCFRSDKLLFVAAGTHLGKLKAPLAPVLVPPVKTRTGTQGLALCEYFATTLFANPIALMKIFLQMLYLLAVHPLSIGSNLMTGLLFRAPLVQYKQCLHYIFVKQG